MSKRDEYAKLAIEKMDSAKVIVRQQGDVDHHAHMLLEEATMYSRLAVAYANDLDYVPLPIQGYQGVTAVGYGEEEEDLRP